MANSDPALFRAVHAARALSCRARMGGRALAFAPRPVEPLISPHAGGDGANDAPAGRFAGNILFGSAAARRRHLSPMALPTKLSAAVSCALDAAAAPGCGVSPRLANVCRPGDACPAGGAVLRPARPPYFDHLRFGCGRSNGGTIGRLRVGFERDDGRRRNRALRRAGSSATVSPVTGASGGVSRSLGRSLSGGYLAGRRSRSSGAGRFRRRPRHRHGRATRRFAGCGSGRDLPLPRSAPVTASDGGSAASAAAPRDSRASAGSRRNPRPTRRSARSWC